ncbi:hypothetical protein FDH34_gp101 [Serratia phage BF]|uniref:Uncharacterized protein n=1 Tax=Serratia phage BF TaxID=1962671 RepID=A0A1S6UA59_9CAUD|nr:hypothetical protein FDH34_gp101 [Serratia phage BF]AQW88626.1 hypothetical protein BF_0101 [Serratia phage BF]
MNYQLSEEQSRDVILQLENYIPIINKLNEVAYNFMMNYYKTYVTNGQYFFGYMSEDKFFKKLGSRSEFFAVYIEDENIHRVRASTLFMGFNNKFLRKHGIIIEPVDAEVIFESVACPRQDASIINKVRTLQHFLSEYANVPFKLGTEELELYERIKTVNAKRIKVLSDVGVEYDL